MWGGKVTILRRIRPYTPAEIATNLRHFLSDSGVLSNQMTVNICFAQKIHVITEMVFGSYL